MSNPVQYPVRFWNQATAPEPTNNPQYSFIIVPNPDGTSSLWHTDVQGRSRLIAGTGGSGLNASSIIEDSTHQFVTAAERAALAALDVVPVVAEAAVSALKGQPLYITNLGRLSVAKADNFNTSRVIGLAANDTTQTNALTADRSAVVQSDWTAVAGTALLTPGATYFLSDSALGMLTTTPPTITGHVVVSIGVALSTTTLQLAIGEPVLL